MASPINNLVNGRYVIQKELGKGSELKQVENESKIINLKAKDIFDGKYPDLS